MKRFSYNLAATLLLLSMAGVNCFATTTAGMLRSNGGVSVNGSSVTPVTTVFAGDRIETAPNAVGNLTANRSSLLLEQNSSVVFSGQSLDFYCGGGTIQTEEAMSARFGRIAVKPAKDSARYQVQQTGATLRISAVQGDLTLTDGGKDYNLPAGNSMNVPYAGCAQQVAKNEAQSSVNTGNSGASAPVSHPTITVPTTGPGLSTAGRVVPLGLVGSVALTGIIAVTHTPVSPQHP